MKRHFSDTLLNFFLRFFYSKAYVSALIAATSNDPGKKNVFLKEKSKRGSMMPVRDTELFLFFFSPFLYFFELFFGLVKNEMI